MSYDWKLPKNHWHKEPKQLNEFEVKQEWYQLRYFTHIRYAEHEYNFKAKRYPDTFLLSKEFWFNSYMPKKVN